MGVRSHGRLCLLLNVKSLLQNYDDINIIESTRKALRVGKPLDPPLRCVNCGSYNGRYLGLKATSIRLTKGLRYNKVIYLFTADCKKTRLAKKAAIPSVSARFALSLAFAGAGQWHLIREPNNSEWSLTSKRPYHQS
jgi:hypothetical protein